MNKKQLIARVQRSMGPGATRSAATAAVEAVLSSIAALVHQSPLHLSGFGTFARTSHPATQGYSIPGRRTQPRPAYSTLSFRPAKSLLPPTAP